VGLGAGAVWNAASCSPVSSIDEPPVIPAPARASALLDFKPPIQ
jgi:hypothetical protein